MSFYYLTYSSKERKTMFTVIIEDQIDHFQPYDNLFVRDVINMLISYQSLYPDEVRETREKLESMSVGDYWICSLHIIIRTK